MRMLFSVSCSLLILGSSKAENMAAPIMRNNMYPPHKHNSRAFRRADFIVVVGQFFPPRGQATNNISQSEKKSKALNKITN